MRIEDEELVALAVPRGEQSAGRRRPVVMG